MIKAVIFDYFGVLCSNDYWQMLKQDERVQETIDEFAEDVNLGKMHWRDFVKEIAKKAEESPEAIEQLYRTERIQPEILTCVHELHKKYRTALITNAHHEFIDPVIKSAKLNDVFDHIIISSQVGFPKPDPRIFKYTLEQLGVEPAEAVLIDDGEHNVSVAQHVGMKGIWYKDFEQMKSELRQLLADSNN